jgi:hypothetical protein
LAPIDPDELSLQVKQRMDELFPDDGDPVAGAEAVGGSAESALGRSRRIVQDLEVESQLNRIRRYLNELSHLRSVFSGDAHLQVLIRVQTAVCRYLLKHPRQLGGASLSLIAEGFAGMERLSAGVPTPVAEKDRLVRVLVRGFHAWKEAVLGEERADGSASGRGAPPAPRLHAAAAGRTAAPSAGSDGPRAYYMIPVEDLDDLKRLLQREIVHLRKEINELLRAR